MNAESSLNFSGGLHVQSHKPGEVQSSYSLKRYLAPDDGC